MTIKQKKCDFFGCWGLIFLEITASLSKKPQKSTEIAEKTNCDGPLLETPHSTSEVGIGKYVPRGCCEHTLEMSGLHKSHMSPGVRFSEVLHLQLLLIDIRIQRLTAQVNGLCWSYQMSINFRWTGASWPRSHLKSGGGHLAFDDNHNKKPHAASLTGNRFDQTRAENKATYERL